MKTTENTKKVKVKMIEVKYSNITFIVEARTHYMDYSSSWARTKYTAVIKGFEKNAHLVGNREFIKSQMDFTNSKANLFLK